MVYPKFVTFSTLLFYIHYIYVTLHIVITATAQREVIAGKAKHLFHLNSFL